MMVRSENLKPLVKKTSLICSKLELSLFIKSPIVEFLILFLFFFLRQVFLNYNLGKYPFGP